jgi:hypothetical protein
MLSIDYSRNIRNSDSYLLIKIKVPATRLSGPFLDTPIRSTVSDSSFIFRFESETGSIVAYKMWNCSVSFHGINVIRQGHPSSDYCAFQNAIF